MNNALQSNSSRTTRKPFRNSQSIKISFTTDASQDDSKGHMQFIMNFYEYHLNNMKNIIVNQNEALNQQTQKIYTYADNENLFRSKINTLEGILQGM